MYDVTIGHTTHIYVYKYECIYIYFFLSVCTIESAMSLSSSWSCHCAVRGHTSKSPCFKKRSEEPASPTQPMHMHMQNNTKKHKNNKPQNNTYTGLNLWPEARDYFFHIPCLKYSTMRVEGLHLWFGLWL